MLGNTDMNQIGFEIAQQSMLYSSKQAVSAGNVNCLESDHGKLMWTMERYLSNLSAPAWTKLG